MGGPTIGSWRGFERLTCSAGEEMMMSNSELSRELVWQKLESKRADPDSSWLHVDWEVHRAKVPGGWFVLTRMGGAPQGIAFYPDPQHVWDGGSDE